MSQHIERLEECKEDLVPFRRPLLLASTKAVDVMKGESRLWRLKQLNKYWRKKKKQGRRRRKKERMGSEIKIEGRQSGRRKKRKLKLSSNRNQESVYWSREENS